MKVFTSHLNQQFPSVTNSELVQVWDHESQSYILVPRRFITNEYCPMGSDATQISNYQTITFTYHQINQIGGLAYDSALALQYDLSGNTYLEPPRGFNWIGYWQTSDPYSSFFYGLVGGKANPTVYPASVPVSDSPVAPAGIR